MLVRVKELKRLSEIATVAVLCHYQSREEKGRKFQRWERERERSGRTGVVCGRAPLLATRNWR